MKSGAGNGKFSLGIHVFYGRDFMNTLMANVFETEYIYWYHNVQAARRV